MNILLKMQSKYSEFTENEKKLMSYILKHKESIQNINITILAENIGVSTSTITRFSKKMGCDNFVDLKMKLNLLHSETKNHSSDSSFVKVHNYYKEIIKQTTASFSEEMIDGLVDDIKKAKKIYFYGVGSSGLSGSEMMHRLLRMGFNVFCITDSHLMIINSAIVSKKDLVIGISVSGETKEVLDALTISKNNGAKVIGITGSEKIVTATPLDKTIIIPNTSFVGNEKFINSQFSAMYLFDLISMALLKDYDLKEKMQKTIDAIIPH